MNPVLLNSQKIPFVCFFLLPAVVLGKAPPGPPLNLVCSSKNRMKFLIKNKNNQKKGVEMSQECFHYIYIYIKKSVKLQI